MKDDFSFFTGFYADLDSDGKVDLGEYLMDEMEYNDIMGEESSDDDYSCGNDNFGNDDTDEYSSEDDTEEYDCVTDCSDCDFDASVSENITAEKEMSNFERRYYDRNEKLYRIGDAIYDNFKTVRDNFERY